MTQNKTFTRNGSNNKDRIINNNNDDDYNNNLDNTFTALERTSSTATQGLIHILLDEFSP